MNKFFLILSCFSIATCFNNICSGESKPVNGEVMKEFVLIGKMKAKPNCEMKLEEVLKTLSLGTYTEPGCIVYALHRDINDPSVFVLVEGWASKVDLEAHFNTPHFLQQFPNISSLIVGEPELTYLIPLGEGKKGNLLK